MTGCDLQALGMIELYFYDELEASERAAVGGHLRSCEECRRALEELTMIRAALAARPSIGAPSGDDWSGFMVRLDEAIRPDRQARNAAQMVTVRAMRPAFRVATYAAMAALVMLVTLSVVYFTRATRRSDVPASPVAERVQPVLDPSAVQPVPGPTPEAAFAALSEQHFERSKLVVIGLASMDARLTDDADWAFERQLATNLLSDTRLYRFAAEERGMSTVARVMADLEMVLLQTSLSDKPDAESLEQIQRLIRKRDLVTKMDVVTGL
jgi:Putative zinc-finger